MTSKVQKGYESVPRTLPTVPTVRPAARPAGARGQRKWYALVFAVGLLAIAPLDASLFDLIIATLADVYLGVSVFVALTLTAFYALDRRFKNGVAELLVRRPALEVPLASLLGALPGCGGAIIVVTQYVNGHMSFGALVAVLVSTMGDAAFLLLARDPQTAALVYGISLLCGLIFGELVNVVHGREALRPRRSEESGALPSPMAITPLSAPAKTLFFLLLAPGVVLGIAGALQLDANRWFGAFEALEPVKWLGFAGAFLGLAIWLSQPFDSWTARFQRCTHGDGVREMVVAETSFVSVWVALGFLSFEMLVYFTALDLGAIFQGLGILTVLIATLIGFVPGCGPQIIVTTLYLNGIVPLSAQLANAISNDGDALFPALALTPRAAVYATLYSAIPALIVGYAVHFAGH